MPKWQSNALGMLFVMLSMTLKIQDYGKKRRDIGK